MNLNKENSTSTASLCSIPNVTLRCLLARTTSNDIYLRNDLAFKEILLQVL